MNGSVAIDSLVARLGDRTDLRASILAEMIFVQDVILEGGSVMPWFLLSSDASLTITPGDRKVAVPGDFLREHDEGQLMIQDSASNWTEVIKDDYDILVQKHGFVATADLPVNYALVGLFFNLFPIPTTANPLTISKYYQADTDPTDAAAENKWLKYAPDLLIAETGLIMALQYLQNTELGTIFTGLANTARTRLITQNIAREEANRSRSMGDD